MSKDDLQSRNEELTALNGQLQATVERQRAISRNLRNILDSTGVATLFLDADLNIRLFTPAASSLFAVAASDVGRPLAGLSRRFADDDLLPDARAVLGGHAPVRRAVSADGGGWFIRAMLPYQGDGRGIEGVVITFADISEIKVAEREVEAARTYLDSILATIRQPLVVLDEDLRVVSASSSFHRILLVEPGDLIGRCLPAAGDYLDVPALREFLASIQVRGGLIRDRELELELPGLGRRAFLMSGRVLLEEPSTRRKFLVAIDDVTEVKQAAGREAAAIMVASLTVRQREILNLVLAGHPSKNIAADLGISQRTVDNHRAAIMKKTGSKSLPALVRTALAAA
jgi:two-component system CheB/CheR fusion protein